MHLVYNKRLITNDSIKYCPDSEENKMGTEMPFFRYDLLSI